MVLACKCATGVCLYVCVLLLCCFIPELGGSSNSQKSYTSNLERTKAADINTDRVRHEAAYCANIYLVVYLFISYRIVLVFSETSPPSERHRLGSRSCSAFITPSIIHSIPINPAVLALTRDQGPPSSSVWLRPG